MFPSNLKQNLSELLKCWSTGLDLINQATQSLTTSDVDIKHGCNKQELEVVN